MKEYKEKESDEYRNYRNDFRDCYSFIENYCKEKYNTGNYLDLLSETTNLTETCKYEIIDLIQQDYIKSSSFNFEVRPNIKSATDFLRHKMLGLELEHNYKKSLERAVYELLQAMRDNITHYGKFEHLELQYNRNLILIKNASKITSTIVKEIELKQKN